MLRNIPYTIRNPRDLDNQLPKTFADLKLYHAKGPQLPAKIKKAP